MTVALAYFWARVETLRRERPDYDVAPYGPAQTLDEWREDGIEGEAFNAYALRRAPFGRLLDIGSAAGTAKALWRETKSAVWLDVRQPPSLPIFFVRGSATRLPFQGASFDTVTSATVLCHVGDDRYGDGFDPHGDMRMLAEIRRVLAPGGQFLCMWGPTEPGDRTISYYSAHRAYAVPHLRALCVQAGFSDVGDWWWPRDPRPGNHETPPENQAYGCLRARV